MKRIITYLYEYHNGKKGDNIGFLKVDIRGTECRIQLHIQTPGKETGKGSVFLVARNEPVEGIPLGEVMLLQGSGEMAWRFSRLRIQGSNYELSQILGAGILFPSGRYLASSWVEDPADELLRGTFRIWKEPEKNEAVQRNYPQNPKKKNQLQLQAASVAASALEKEENNLESSQPPSNVIPMQNAVSMKLPRSQFWTIHQGTKPESEMQMENATKPEPEMQMENATKPEPETEEEKDLPSEPEAPETNNHLRRIDINYIRKLPKRNWYLCNNSFLIHGFFNYHYLVLKEVEQRGIKKLYLGVPGIYEKPERAMALLFGFPEFASAPPQNPEQGAMQEEDNVSQMQSSGSSKEVPDGTFGYWFCLLDT